MFGSATVFNQNIASWNTARVLSMIEVCAPAIMWIGLVALGGASGIERRCCVDSICAVYGTAAFIAYLCACPLAAANAASSLGPVHSAQAAEPLHGTVRTRCCMLCNVGMRCSHAVCGVCAVCHSLLADVHLCEGLQPEPRELECAVRDLVDIGLHNDGARGLLQEGHVHRLGHDAANGAPHVELACSVHPEVRTLIPQAPAHTRACRGTRSARRCSGANADETWCAHTVG